jgi:succinyl-CoA synthetase alpha subunit
MAILIDKNTRLITQGITGKAGLFHSQKCRDYGTNVVGGVTPKKGGTTVDGFAVFNTVREAREAADAGIELIVAITEGIPVMDMLRVHNAMKGMPNILIGPNCPGVTTADVCKIGIAPGPIHKRGKIGIVSRSGTLTYEAVHQTTLLGLGQTTAVGIGGDPVHGLSHLDVVKMFNEDPETEGIVLIGEIGGTDEEAAAAYIKQFVKKPVAGFIAGASAPKGKRMGHAGAIVDGNSGTAQSKKAAMADAGIFVAETAAEIGRKMVEAMASRR